MAQASESRGEGAYWHLMVENIPAFGYKQYSIEVSDINISKDQSPSLSNNFESDYYKILVFTKQTAGF